MGDVASRSGRPSSVLCRRLGRIGAVALAALAIGSVAEVYAAAAAAPKPTPRASAADDAGDLARQLKQAQAALSRLQTLADSGAPPPLVEEQRNLTARLTVLLAAQLRQAAASAAPDAVADEVHGAATPLGSPPYAVADVDALRDEADALREQRQSLELTAHALDTQVAALLAARRKAEETERLRQERLERAREPDVQQRLAADVAVAGLEARIAGLELGRADAERAAVRARIDRLRVRAEALEREIERARARQWRDDEAIARVAAAARAVRQSLTEQRRRLEARLAARERTASAVGTPAKTAAQTATQELRALRVHLELLAELDQIEAGREEVWRQRRLALAAGTDPTARDEARAVLARSIEQLALRAQAATKRLQLARTALREQRLRFEAFPDGPTAAAERRALDAMQQQVDTLETIVEQLLRLQQLLQRSLEDLDAASPSVPLHQRIGRALRGAVTAAWQYELFSVSESQLVDGRSVTVDYGVTVGKSIGVVGLFVLGGWLASLLSRAAIGLMVQRMGLSPQLGKVLNRWVMSLLLLGVLIVVLKLARIPLTVFAFLGGALAIGVGFGAQNIIKNLISGVIILFERKVRVGDIVTIDGVSGTVSSVDLRATTLRGFDGIAAIVPNSQLLENRVSNWSYGSPTIRRAIVVGLRYDSDMRRASDIVRTCAEAHPAVLDTPAPEVLFDDFGPDAQTLRLHYWLRLEGPKPGPVVDSDLRHAIGEALAAAGLVIAYPQRDVHLDLIGPVDVRLQEQA